MFVKFLSCGYFGATQLCLNIIYVLSFQRSLNRGCVQNLHIFEYVLTTYTIIIRLAVYVCEDGLLCILVYETSVLRICRSLFSTMNASVPHYSLRICSSVGDKSRGSVSGSASGNHAHSLEFWDK